MMVSCMEQVSYLTSKLERKLAPAFEGEDLKCNIFASRSRWVLQHATTISLYLYYVIGLLRLNGSAANVASRRRSQFRKTSGFISFFACQHFSQFQEQKFIQGTST